MSAKYKAEKMRKYFLKKMKKCLEGTEEKIRSLSINDDDIVEEVTDKSNDFCINIEFKNLKVCMVGQLIQSFCY